MGCILRKEFPFNPDEFPHHVCKVYRRVRWVDAEKTRKYKDWKVKIL